MNAAKPKKRPLALPALADDFDPFSMGLPPPPSASQPPPPPPPRPAGGRAPLKPLSTEYRDQNCYCRDCGRLFILTAEQQQQLAAKGFATVAKSRCAACAKHKKNRFGARVEEPIWRAPEQEAKLGNSFKYQVKGNSQAAASLEEEDEEKQSIRPAPRSRQGEEYYDVKADMLVYGKPLGGGMPVGVVCSDAEDDFDFYDCGDAADERGGGGERRGSGKKGALEKGKKTAWQKRYKGGYSL